MKILFVLHEASRTGAPFTQLHLMRWLKQHADCQMMLLLLNGGDLVGEFEQLAEVYVVNKPYVPASISRRIRNRITQLLRPDSDRLLQNIKRFTPDLIFANTAVALGYAAALKAQLGIKLISYLHELEITFYYISAKSFALDAAQVDKFIMGSEAVNTYYQKTFAVAPEKTQVIYDFIEGKESVALLDIRSVHGIASHSQIVGGMASIIWRKGPELFVEVARRVLKTNPDTYFVWVGGKPTSFSYLELQRDVRMLGLSDRIILAGEQTDIRSYYEAFDVFLLTSREDPFPLVCLEAALAYTPVVCFADAGGMPEFVRDDAGAVVPYLDLDGMARAVVSLLNSKILSKKQAQTAHERVLQMCTIDVAGPQIVKMLEREVLMSN